LQVIGQSAHQDIKNGIDGAAGMVAVEKLLDSPAKPSWVAGVLRAASARSFRPNIVGTSKAPRILTKLSEWTASQFDTLAETGRTSTGSARSGRAKLILKGILDVEDAEGSRQDRRAGACRIPTWAAASSTARRPRSRCCPKSSTRSARDGNHVRRAIRSGQDVMRALALGAKSWHDRRAYAYGPRRRRTGRRRQGARHHRQGNAHHMGLCGVNTIARDRDR